MRFDFKLILSKRILLIPARVRPARFVHCRFDAYARRVFARPKLAHAEDQGERHAAERPVSLLIVAGAASRALCVGYFLIMAVVTSFARFCPKKGRRCLLIRNSVSYAAAPIELVVLDDEVEQLVYQPAFPMLAPGSRVKCTAPTPPLTPFASDTSVSSRQN